ncbi:MAG: PhoH family protein [Candidatus Saccharimonadaceae bacterium]
MGSKQHKRLPEKQSTLAQNFRPRNAKQQQLVELIENNEIVIAKGVPGSGKAQPLYSIIYTPTGPVPMGSVFIGMEVCTPDGGVSKITDIYPQGLKDCYRIHFSDNVYSDCCDEHLWKVYTDKDRKHNQKNKDDQFSILQTKDMIGSVLIGSDSRKNYKLPITAPLKYSSDKLPLDPYILGLLIGDGGMTGSNTIISSKDEEIISYIKENIKIYNLDLFFCKGSNCDYRFANKDNIKGKQNYINFITGELGVRCKSEFKTIPREYLYSSISDRISLLQGLMDSCKRSGSSIFSTSSQLLNNSFCELVRSLGGIANTTIKKTKSLPNYITYINLPNEVMPFRLERKRELVILKTKYQIPRYITNIEYIGKVNQQCISIDSEEHLYITDNHIVTHNTYVALAAALNMLGGIYKQIVLVKSVTTLPGEEIGFLKGGISEKMEPHIMSYVWNINKICGEGAAEALMEKNLIKVLPLAFIRGLSIDNSIVIIDEAQNLDNHTFKTIMSRIGEDSKYVFLGDTEQIDRKHKNESCLESILCMFANSNLIGTMEFFDEDCVRNPIIPKILSVLRENNI